MIRFTHLLALLVVIASGGLCPPLAEAKEPHIVVFLADDLGWADCSLYGGKDVLTPNMARLAADGMTLTHSGDGDMNRYPLRAVRTRDWKYVRNLDPTAEHHTHVDKAAAGDGRDYWDSWTAKAKTDPAAAAVVKRYHTRPAEELYDVLTDPWELKNLAADPKYADRLKAMRADLDAWMKDNGDEGLKTERALPDPRPKKKDKP